MLLKAAKFERRRFYSVGLPRLAQRSGILNFATSAPYRVIVRPLPLAVSWAAYSRRMLSSPAQRASAAGIVLFGHGSHGLRVLVFAKRTRRHPIIDLAFQPGDFSADFAASRKRPSAHPLPNRGVGNADAVENFWFEYETRWLRTLGGIDKRSNLLKIRWRVQIPRSRRGWPIGFYCRFRLSVGIKHVLLAP